jgi:hypothetical protein
VNQDNTSEPEDPAAPKPAGGRSRRLKATSAVATVGLIAVAGVGTLNMAQAVNAADPASATSGSSAAAAATTAPGATVPATGGRMAGGPHETVTDTSVAATAIGIKEADLITALNGGQTLADVAKANNVDVKVVIDALVKDKQDELAAEVKAGTLTQAQADAEAATITQQATAQVNGTFQGGGPGHDGHGAGGRQETVTDTSVVANAIGITEAKLIAALNSGQTPADVAKANNVDVQVVIDALVKDGEQELSAQVTAGTITQAQADAQKAAVLQRATDQANGTLNVGGGRHEPDADDQATPSSSPSTNG